MVIDTDRLHARCCVYSRCCFRYFLITQSWTQWSIPRMLFSRLTYRPVHERAFTVRLGVCAASTRAIHHPPSHYAATPLMDSTATEVLCTGCSYLRRPVTISLGKIYYDFHNISMATWKKLFFHISECYKCFPRNDSFND